MKLSNSQSLKRKKGIRFFVCHIKNEDRISKLLNYAQELWQEEQMQMESIPRHSSIVDEPDG